MSTQPVPERPSEAEQHLAQIAGGQVVNTGEKPAGSLRSCARLTAYKPVARHRARPAENLKRHRPKPETIPHSSANKNAPNRHCQPMRQRHARCARARSCQSTGKPIEAAGDFNFREGQFGRCAVLRRWGRPSFLNDVVRACP